METASWTVDSDQLTLLKLNAVLLTFGTLNWLGRAENCTLRNVNIIHRTQNKHWAPPTPLINALVDRLF